MNTTSSNPKTRWKAIALSTLTLALFAASLAFAGTASAAYKARVDSGTLTITGDGAGDKLVLRLDASSPNTLQVDVGGDGTADFSFDRTTFTAIVVEAGGGDDEVRIDQSGGAITDEAITMNGGDGADTLVGGFGVETLGGGKGNDFVDGNGGADRALLGDGDDRFQWNPGDGSDVVEGQGGRDLLDFFGANIGEKIDVAANGSRVRFTRDIAAIMMDLDDVERIGYHAFGGADTVTVDDLTGTDAKTVAVDLAGAGGVGDSLVDTVVARGTDGTDRPTVASAAGEVLVSGLYAQLQVAGSEPAFDVVGVATLGGADTIATGVGVSGPAAIAVDGGEGTDTARFTGTAAADTIDLFGNGSVVSTLAPGTSRVDTTAVESLGILGLAGGDAITATGSIAAVTALTIDGGDGDDTLRGGNGADMLIGGKGNDDVDGNQGNDTALLGDGDDRFEWNPGDASDIVDGQNGVDALDFFGSNIGETIIVVANGKRVRLTRDIGSVGMDFATFEAFSLHAFGGADTIVVDDLTDTGLKTVDLDLAAIGGVGDAMPDTILVNGTSRRDVVQLGRTGSDVSITGLPAQIGIAGGEGANDTLFLQTLGGDDEVTVAPTVGDLIAPVVNLGADE